MKTPTIRYYIEPKNKEIDKRVIPETILVEVNYGYFVIGKNGKKRSKPFRISLRSKIHPTDFGNKQDNFVYDDYVFKKFSRKNNTIKVKMGLLEKAVYELENHYVVKQMIPTPNQYKEALKIKLYGISDDRTTEQTILDFLYKKIANDEENLKIGQKKGISEGTIKTYRTLSRHLENYQLATGDTLTFSNFDEAKYWNLWRIINKIFKGEITVNNPNQPKKQPTNPHGYSSSSLQKYQIDLLHILRLAKRKNKIAIDLDDASLKLEDSESMKDFYVTEMELQKIIETDVSHDFKFQRAKEYTIIASLTGMRFESVIDTFKETIQHYNEDGFDFKYIHSKHNKTKTEVYIPLLKPIREILEKHNGKFPKFPANQTINADLKTFFAELGINESVTLTKVTYSDGTITTNVPKSTAISTHDFKHTFYSNLYKHKVNQSVIDDITHPDKGIPPSNPILSSLPPSHSFVTKQTL